MPAPPPRSSFPWHTLVIGALTLGLLWWFFSTLNVRMAFRSMRTADPLRISLGMAMTFVVYVFRAWRWQALLAPIGTASFRNAFRTTVMGFTATNLLPGRPGEVIRPYLLARAEGFNAASTFATVIIERVLDLGSVLLLFTVFLATTPIDVGRDVKLAGILSALAAAMALGALAVGAGHPERLGKWTARLTGALPSRASTLASGLVETFVRGLVVMRRPSALFLGFVLSIGLWVAIATGIWLVSGAFALTISFQSSFLVLLFLVVGVLLPTPAGVGGFQVMFVSATAGFLGAPRDAAGACAIVLQVVMVVPISVLGIVFMAKDGLSLARLRAMKPVAEAAERPEEAES